MIGRNSMKRLIIRLLVVAVMMFAATSAFADYSYNFTANTSSVAGQTGYIELQYNPNEIAQPLSAAVVSNFVSDAVLGSVTPTGAVTGALPSALTINNTDGWNDYFQQVTFGSTVQFSLDLSGSTNNSFGLSFWGSDGATPILTSDTTDGYATIVNLTSTGAAVTNNSIEVNVAQTPIPAAAWLFGSGLLGLFGIRRNMIV